MKISNKLKQTIISESAFNDAAAAIITFTIVGVISGGTLSIGNSIIRIACKSWWRHTSRKHIWLYRCIISRRKIDGMVS